MLGYKQLAAATWLLCALVISAPGFAQLEEIIVTAQKREASLQDVPISVSALAGDQFDAFDVARADDLDKVFTNISLNRNSTSNTGIAIRGVGTDNVHLSGQQSVGTYIDDVSLVSPFVGAIGVYDIARVEVLRGPQNTLYGRNTTGGAIVWHTNRATPGDGTHGYGRMRVGNGGLARFEGAAEFDFSEQFAARIAVMSDGYDGVWKNVMDGSATGNAYDRTGERANFVWDSGENTTIGVTLTSGRTDGEDAAFRAIGNLLPSGLPDPTSPSRTLDSQTSATDTYIAATSAAVAAVPYLQDQFDRGTGVVIVNPQPGPFDRLVNFSTDLGWVYQSEEDGFWGSWDGVRLEIDHSFENIDLNWISSYDDTHFKERNGQEPTGFTPHREGDWKVWQHELRFSSATDGPIQWLGGAYITDSESGEDTWVANVGAAGGMGVSPGVIIDSRYEAWSLYGQADWFASDALTLTLGLRYTDDELSADNDNWVRTVCGFYPSNVGQSAHDRNFRRAGCPGGRLLAGNTDSPVQSLSETGWKVGADYKFDDSAMAYGSVSYGFKGGSYDNRALSTGDDPIGPEFLTAYEVGYKSEFADNTLQLNLAAFIYDWEGMQLFESLGGIPALINVPGIESKGVEAEFKWRPSENLYLQGSVGTADTAIVDIDGINPASIAEVGKEVTKSPDLTYNLLGLFTQTLNNGELTLMINYRYESDSFYTFLQSTPADTAESHGYLNARISYFFGQEGQHQLAIWGNNLTGEFACSRAILGAGAAPLDNGCEVKAFGEAMYGITFETRFGSN